MTLRDRIYYKILPCFLALMERFELVEYERQRAFVNKCHSREGGNLSQDLRLRGGNNSINSKNHLFLTHGRGGGVDKFVEDTAASIEASNKQAWILHYNPLKRRFILSRGKIKSMDTKCPHPTPLPLGEGRVGKADAGEGNVLNFKFPSQYGEMIKHLQSLDLGQLHIHHTRYLPLYFLKDLPDFAGTLGIPYDYTMHDYIAFCPRVHLIDSDFSCCGMPQDASACTTCVKKNGFLTRAPADAALWRKMNRELLSKAAELIAPSHDTAERHKIILGDMTIKVVPHDAPKTTLRKFPAKVTNEPYVIGVIGRIHRHKGAGVVMACAEDAKKRNLPLRFTIIGNSIYDNKLRESGVTITGTYKESELPKLLEQSKASLVFLPSVWPETYSYVLSHIWENGYFPVAFDLGAPAERIRQAQCGLVLPTEMMNSPSAINDALLEAAKKQHQL